MKKTIKVSRHTREDGSVVEAHDRVIESKEPDSLSDEIKKRKRDKEQSELLFQFAEEK